MNARLARRVLALTALDLEYQAVSAHLTELRRHPHPAGTLFETGYLPGGEIEIVLALTGAGNTGAAVLAEWAMSTFGPQALLFVGVAGALTDDIKLGDVVVATRVYAYHGGKEADGGVLTRPRAWDASHELEQRAHHIARAGVVGQVPAGHSSGAPARSALQTHRRGRASAGFAREPHRRASAQHLEPCGRDRDGRCWSHPGEPVQPVAAHAHRPRHQRQG